MSSSRSSRISVISFVNIGTCYRPIFGECLVCCKQEMGVKQLMDHGGYSELLTCHRVGHFPPKLISLAHCFIDEKKKL
jgi:hypothetical protein